MNVRCTKYDSATCPGCHAGTIQCQPLLTQPYHRGSRDVPPEDVDVLVPGACEYVISRGKEDTVSVIKFEILR